jgi:hypothetical protein
MNGISYTPSAFKTEKPMELSEERSIHCGRNLKNTESKKPPMVAKSAAFDVAFFQKKPKMNMAKIPGETNPVYSWIYLKPPFSIPRCGAIKIAIAIATTMVYFPVVTSDDSLAEGFIFFW